MEFSFAAGLAIFLGGAIGGSVRAWLSARIPGATGLMLVNGSGSFALGLLAANAELDSAVWLFLATGVFGAFTTVSSFALQTVQMWQAGAQWRAVFNTAGSAAISVIAVVLGLWLGSK